MNKWSYKLMTCSHDNTAVAVGLRNYLTILPTGGERPLIRTANEGTHDITYIYTKRLLALSCILTEIKNAARELEAPADSYYCISYRGKNGIIERLDSGLLRQGR